MEVLRLLGNRLHVECVDRNGGLDHCLEEMEEKGCGCLVDKPHT